MYLNRYKRGALFSFFLTLCFLNSKAQANEPSIVLKNNLLYSLTTTLNLGAEIKLGSKYTLDIGLNYNPWDFSGNRKIKHVLVQPEIRHWLTDSFDKHFFGFHMLYSHYNAAKFNDKRYQGNFYGAGFSYGYHWAFNQKWSMEAVLGLGYLHSQYDKYLSTECGQFLGSGHKNYVGPTKIGLSLIYKIN